MTQRLRLISGLVLLTYVTSHLLNHSLGVISLGTAEAGRFWFIGLWRNPLGTTVLYLGLSCHLTLVLWALYRRRHLRLPAWELVRLTLGLLIPLQLLQHVLGTRVQHEAFGVEDNYARQVLTYWLVNPTAGLQQIALLIVAWSHGCIGLWSWLRVKPGRGYTLAILRIVGPLLPLLALAGFANMGLEVSERARDPDWLYAALQPLGPAESDRVQIWRNAGLAAYLSLIGLVGLARQIRAVWEHRQGVVTLTYPSGQRVPIGPGTTVLEASQAAGIPHTSICGGRGRCSTCRVRVGAGLDRLPSPSATEARVLQRIQAPANVRLACQLRPTVDLEVFPLFPVTPSSRRDRNAFQQAAGREQEVAVLFADLRSFTQFAEHRLPYDVVFILNEYFAAMGGAIERSGGRLDKFIGDGVMALFGLDTSAETGCRQALAGAAAMVRALEQLNTALAHDLREPLRLGIGLHIGTVIVGDLGYGQVRSLTAIGDAVNTASRLESLTKEYACQIVASDDVFQHAGLAASPFPQYEIQVRGRTAPLLIHTIADPAGLERALAI